MSYKIAGSPVVHRVSGDLRAGSGIHSGHINPGDYRHNTDSGQDNQTVIIEKFFQKRL
jgi:hypothetical protein